MVFVDSSTQLLMFLFILNSVRPRPPKFYELLPKTWFIMRYLPFIPDQVHSHMMGMTPYRVPLPPDGSQDEPIFVNAKQFKAIMKRREARAKLEAQNKVSKIRMVCISLLPFIPSVYPTLCHIIHCGRWVLYHR